MDYQKAPEGFIICIVMRKVTKLAKILLMCCWSHIYAHATPQVVITELDIADACLFLRNNMYLEKKNLKKNLGIRITLEPATVTFCRKYDKVFTPGCIMNWIEKRIRW